MPYSYPKIIRPGKCRTLSICTEKQNYLNSGKKSKKSIKMAQIPAAKAGDMHSQKKKLNKSCCGRILQFYLPKLLLISRKKIFLQNSLPWEKFYAMKP